MAFSSFQTILFISVVFRLGLIVYGEWQDKHMEVRYTDVDYIVFSDAASLMAAGKSPFARSTYRYSPLLAFLLLPNCFIHPAWGKFIFSASDLLVGLFVYQILRKRLVPENMSLYCMSAWLFNPFTFTIGTRGNCEPIVCAIILWIIISLINGNILQSAFWYGLIVHFRIYPIIYALPILLVLEPRVFPSSYKPTISKWGLNHNDLHTALEIETVKPYVFLKGLITRKRIYFGFISASVFFTLTDFFFSLYGWEFLNEVLIYHLTRTDPRHNFSIYFYHMYLHHEQALSILQKLISFLPQWTVQLVLVYRFARDLPFCLFLQTAAFVAFNKVITAQYFVWFFCLLPLILPWCKIQIKWKGIIYITLWMGAQMNWLLWGYFLEFKGKNVLVQLWWASILFMAANTCVLVIIMRNYIFCPTFVRSERVDSDRPCKIE